MWAGGWGRCSAVIRRVIRRRLADPLFPVRVLGLLDSVVRQHDEGAEEHKDQKEGDDNDGCDDVHQWFDVAQQDIKCLGHVTTAS